MAQMLGMPERCLSLSLVQPKVLPAQLMVDTGVETRTSL